MNRYGSHFKPLPWLMALLLAAFGVGCADTTSPETSPPTVSSTVPANAATGVAHGANIIVTFSEAMDATTITTTTFALKQGATVVPGAVSYAGTTATFDPTSALAGSTTYTATLGTGAKDVAGNALAADKTWSFTTATAPSASSSVPASGATGVAIDANITAVFSQAMDPATITPATFTLKQGTTLVPGAVSYVGTTATFNPTSTLAPTTPYTATVSTGVKDLAGNALAADNTWSFTTGLAPDTTAPSVSSTIPGDATTGVALDGNLAATFSEAMDAATITTTTFTLKQGTAVIPGAVSYVGTTATFNPTSDLAGTTLYTATIGTGAKDLAGNPLAAAKTWTFTTGVAPDTTAPSVSATVPASAASGVAVNANVTATFSEAMNPSTITTATFTLKQGTTVVPGAVTSPSTTTATFDPTSDLANSTVYTATISTGAKDLAGNAMAVDKTWSFTTGAAAARGPAPVLLGTAGNFVILTKTGITNVAPTAITGNIGSSPITGAAMTGLDCTQVSGTIYTVDSGTGPVPCSVQDAVRLTTAVSDMQIAYTNAAGRVGPDFIELASGAIGGLTLAPGLYKWSTGVSILSDVTLDGGPNDVWIFQIGGVLSQAIATRVNLTGGAQAKNIFWQGISSAGLQGHLEGIVLSATTVTLGTGASVNGRLLAQTAVTLLKNTITQPGP